jgi:rhamnosyltransferase subunit B
MRVLFATIGSLGDLHPCLGLASELKRRGHTVVVASPEAHRTRVLDLGLEYRGLRPNLDPADSALIRQCEDLKSGFEVLISKLILPHLADTYSDLLAAAGDCDFMLAGEMVYAAPLVAEKTGLRWGSIILSPCSFLSAHDPSLLAPMPQLIRLRGLGWRINRALLELFTRLARHWWEPVKQLRIREGLNPDCAPLTFDKFSPQLVLALFSSAFAEPQPDWPGSTVQPGFVFYDQSTVTSELLEIAQFLKDGDPPIVFTLGSTAVSNPGNFYESSLEAALRLGNELC